MATGMKEAYEEGRRAYYNGESRDSNPYGTLNAFLRVAWFRGYDQAARGY